VPVLREGREIARSQALVSSSTSMRIAQRAPPPHR
jgi:hypothetical protein